MPRDTKDGYNRPHSPEDYEKGWKPWDKSKGGFWQGGTHWSEVEANTEAALQSGFRYTFLHYGFHAWAIYVVTGLSLAYYAYSIKALI